MASGKTAGLSQRKPMRKTFPVCCARTATGHAAAAPPMNEMNSRRLIASPEARTGHRTGSTYPLEGVTGGHQMSALGHKRTYAVHQPMSALHPIATAKADMRKGPC